MKYLIAAACILAMAGCKDSGRTTSANLPYARQQGREAAQRVIDARPGSMEQVNAILDIRAKEYQILQAGDSIAAAAFARAAKAKLDSAGVFKQD